MDYSFSVEYASKYGVNEAIVIKNFQFWILKNQKNNKHLYDGRTWTYNSISALQELFPFWKTHQIRYIIDKLVTEGVLIKGNYNKAGYDLTTWYAFVNEDEFLSLVEPAHPKPLKPQPPEVEEEEEVKVKPNVLFEAFWEEYGYKKGKYASLKLWQKLKAGETMLAREKIPEYKSWVLKSYGDLKYMKKPANYLKEKIFLDDFSIDNKNKFKDYKEMEEV